MSGWLRVHPRWHLIKILERVVRKRLVVHLETNNLLSGTPHGFRKGRGCLTQLLQHYDEILNNLNNSDETDVLYLDYAKAFDKVDHNILLNKLTSYVIKGKLSEWIKAFLTNRYQRVTVDGRHYTIKNVISGVLQGSVALHWLQLSLQFISHCSLNRLQLLRLAVHKLFLRLNELLLKQDLTTL